MVFDGVTPGLLRPVKIKCVLIRRSLLFTMVSAMSLGTYLLRAMKYKSLTLYAWRFLAPSIHRGIGLVRQTTAPACSCPTVFRQIFRGEMLLSSTEFQGKLQIFLEPWLHRARWRGRCGHRFLIALLECNLYPSCLHNGTTRKGSARSPERFVQLAAVLLFLAVRR